MRMVSIEQFFELVQSYNDTFWPVIGFTYLLGIIAIYLAYKKSELSDKIISGFLAFLWIWSGLIFWIATFGPYPFSMFNVSIPGIWVLLGIGFIIQGCLFIFFGIYKPSLSFKTEFDSYFYLGLVFMLYAVFVYPVIGIITGHSYFDYLIFGIAPCPVTIFTFGFFLWTDKKFNILLIVFPLIYSLSGVIPLFLFEVFADLGLIIIGIIGFSLIVYRDKKKLIVP